MFNLEEKYIWKCQNKSDINEHLPTLKRYADECNHIVEMGVRDVVSTYAFMMGKPKHLISYDIVPLERYGVDVNELMEVALLNGVDFQFRLENTLLNQIVETDLLFLDTDHTYSQVKCELDLHGNMSRKYIIFHDTTSYEFSGMHGDGIGIWMAITDFITKNPHWSIHERFTNNNGLTILKRQ
jgi:hypothetical protein